MKRAILSLFYIICFCFLFSQTIPRTLSISEDQLTSIRNASLHSAYTPNDPLIFKFWDDYTRETRDTEEDSVLLDRDRFFTDNFILETPAIDAYKAIIDFENPLYDYRPTINNIRNYLCDFDYYDFKLAIHNPNGLDYINPDPADYNGMEWKSGWGNLDSYTRGRELAYDLMYISFMVDMLFYASSTSSDPQAATKMDAIVDSLNSLIHWTYESFFDYDYLPPTHTQIGWNNLGWNISSTLSYPSGICSDTNDRSMPDIGNEVNRMIIVSGIGYGCLVTGEIGDYPENMDLSPNSLSLINFVKNEFHSSSPLPASTEDYGMNDYYVTHSGMYVGSITYQNRVLYLTPLFFSALNRKCGINLYNATNSWNCDFYPKMVKNVLHRIDPQLQHITKGDDWRYDGLVLPNVNASGYEIKRDHSKQIERGLLSYYYQNTDDTQTRDNIRWYVQQLYNKNGNSYPRELWEWDLTSSFSVVISYDTNSISFNNPLQASTPDYLTQGTYSNSELLVLRKPSSTYTDDYEKSSMLVINHENSFNYSGHKNEDKTAFQLYLGGKPIIIEGGYAPASKWTSWFRSAFSQNVLLVNPDFPSAYSQYMLEDSYLSIPYSDPFTNSSEVVREDPTSEMQVGKWGLHPEQSDYFKPSYKQYLFKNQDIEHLKVGVRYNNSVSSTNFADPSSFYPCRVERNFYRAADKYYIILDKAIQEDIYPNTYRSQMHFLEETGYALDEITGLTGAWRFSYPVTKSLVIALGSTAGNAVYTHRTDLPLGWRYWDHTLGKKQQRLSYLTAASSNPQDYFLTFLLPGVDPAVNPIVETVTGSTYYGAVLNDASNRIYTGVKSIDGIAFSTSGFRINSDAAFFSVTTDANFSACSSFIINEGNSLSVRDLTGTRFGTKSIFQNTNQSFEETIAEWKDQMLYVTLRVNTLQIPRYKIARYGVLPENFISKTQYGTDPDYNNNTDTTTVIRGEVLNNISSLAYDDLYFYVNYTYPELVADNLGSDLVLYSGEYPGLQIYGTLTLGTGSLVFDGQIGVHPGAHVSVLEKAEIRMTNGNGINIRGDFVSSQAIYTSDPNTRWGGFTVESKGSLELNNCTISQVPTAIYCVGSLDIYNSQLHDGTNGIILLSPSHYVIDGCRISNFSDYGIKVIDAYLASQRSIITNDSIYENGTGLFSYNSET